MNAIRRFLSSLFGSRPDPEPAEERRTGTDRRTGADRRAREGEPLGTDRRSGKERRAREDRRNG
jgi:hypothetical protein